MLSQADRINNAVQWYRSNRADIEAILPIKTLWNDGVGFSIYPENWNIECWCDRWEAKKLKADEAEQLINEQLRPLRRVLQERRGMLSEGQQVHFSPPARKG